MYVPPPFHPSRPQLVRPVGVDSSGADGPTRGESRGPHWRTTSRGLFVPVTVERTAEQRIVEAAAVLREDEAVTGWAALHWAGAAWFDGTHDGTVPRDVPVVARRHLIAQPGFAVSQEFLHPDEIEVVDGVPVTTAVRSVVFEMRYAAGPGDAIVALDMACYSDQVSLAEVTTYVGALGPVTGIQQARDALAQGEENSWSPQETRMRGVWTLRAGLARPLCNAPVFTLDGQHVGTPDCIDPELGLLGLYNGSDHLSLVGASADLRQESAYRALGLEPVTMLATDWLDLDGFVERLGAAARRVRSTRGPRLWTVEPPSWWTPTHTVARRRGLGASEQARLLRYRRAA
jgi:hypothetical protein